jgi:hypothetical protein
MEMSQISQKPQLHTKDHDGNDAAPQTAIYLLPPPSKQATFHPLLQTRSSHFVHNSPVKIHPCCAKNRSNSWIYVRKIGIKVVRYVGGGPISINPGKVRIDGTPSNSDNFRQAQVNSYLNPSHLERGPIHLIQYSDGVVNNWQPSHALNVLLSSHPFDRPWQTFELKLIKKKCQLPRQYVVA